MKHGQNSSCEAVHKFDDDSFEMLEYYIKKDFKGIDKQIKDMKIKEGVLVVAILRGKNVIFPNGQDFIKEKDTIVVIDNSGSIIEINDILE